MNTPQYWNDRYETGVGAGDGSRGQLLKFKVETVQSIVDKYKIKSVIDVGCGDGRQLSRLDVSKYIGLDISSSAIDKASSFTDKNREYFILNEDTTAKGEQADMAISLDVVMHLPYDQFLPHIATLFRIAKRYVLIYGPNRNGADIRLAPHMFFREFAADIEEKYKLKPIEVIRNAYPVEGEPKPGRSYSDFYLYDKKNGKREETEQDD